MKVNVYEAKTKLSALLKRAARGEEILIARDGAPVARLVPVDGGAPRSRRVFPRPPPQTKDVRSLRL